MAMLDDIMARLGALPEAERAKLVKAVAGAGVPKFVPTDGPQTDAYLSKADLTFYGGAAGGGKTALIGGLALQEHRRSLIMRREYTALSGVGGIIEEVLAFHGTRDGFNGSPPARLSFDGRMITFGSAKNLGDERAYQGRARDFLALDEAVQFLESQVRFLMGWVRSSDPGQRCRTLLASNPPVGADGDWVIGWFRPWLDLTHPKPAKPGELRWYVTAPDGSELEVDSSTPVEMGGRTVQPQSRTFIPARLADNPYLVNTGYAATLDSMPEPLRSAMRDGNFMIARVDDPWQVIPSDWVRAAQARWHDDPPEGAPMSAMGVDVAQGGKDNTVLACRYDGWFAPLEVYPGEQTPTGPDVAGLVLSRRKHGAVVNIDMGGGWGGSAFDHLKEILPPEQLRAHVGAAGSEKRSVEGMLRFANKRAEIWWRLREALDPGQEGGSPIMLPDDPALVADLTAPTYKVNSGGRLQIESKEDLVKRLGRSPDRGDAVTMSWASGPRMASHGAMWRERMKDLSPRGRELKVNMSHQAARRKR